MTIPARSSGPGSSQPLLLAIETAGSGCSAAILRGAETLAAEHRALRHGHAEALLPMIDRVARAAGVEPGALDLVAAATGPGGFTGIRAGLAAAQGIALASGARLVGVTSFAAVAAALADPRSRVAVGASDGQAGMTERGRCWSRSTAGAPIFTSSSSPRIVRRRWPNPPRCCRTGSPLMSPG